ncbi:hypothetical protein [Acinetobacter sp.]|uniref:hypothetical protein n=1 Tax=Acinetobacter sp. TaxID=472 RepID=UPI003D02EF53
MARMESLCGTYWYHSDGNIWDAKSQKRVAPEQISGVEFIGEKSAKGTEIFGLSISPNPRDIYHAIMTPEGMAFWVIIPYEVSMMTLKGVIASRG